MSAQIQNTGVYRSGVAARLSGVPVNTLRIWERRYSVINPQLSEGRQRLYSLADIRRLTMIKQAVDMGHPIGTVASLGLEELMAMQAATSASQDKPSVSAASRERSEIRVVLVGPLMGGEQFGKALSSGALRVTGHSADLGKAVVDLKDTQADIAIIDLPTINDADVGRVTWVKDACGAQSAIVLYRFAPSAMVRSMRTAGHVVARATSDPAEIETICLGLLRQPRLEAAELGRLLQSANPRPPRFDEQFLAKLSNMSPTLACECPKHVVELLMGLSAFERYSAECASRSPSDVALHLELRRATGLARSIMEHALERLAAEEGIDLPSPAMNPGETPWH